LKIRIVQSWSVMMRPVYDGIDNGTKHVAFFCAAVFEHPNTITPF